MIFISVQFYFLYEKITWALYVVSCFFGFTILPIYPVLIEFSAELVFPVGEVNTLILKYLFIYYC